MGAWIETTLEANYIVQPEVAPCVGAWIETFVKVVCVKEVSVAPCVGAWIETRETLHARSLGMSHPAWVRGLKQD